MIKIQPPLRPATLQDAQAMAELVNMAGEGLPLYLWTQMAAPDENPWDVGRSRAQREEGGFSWRNTVVREEDGEVVACLIGYPLADDPDPVDYEGMPAMFVPMQELEEQAPGTWYVNVLATYPEHRGKAYGAKFLSLAEMLARDAGKRGLSVMVSDANRGARRLYERCGYTEYASRAMVKEKWQNDGKRWVLLVKEL